MNVFLDAKEESVRILMEDISASAQKYNHNFVNKYKTFLGRN